MFESFAQLFPAEWRGTITLLAAPVRWIPEWQAMLLRSTWLSYSPAATAAAAVVLLLPVLLLVAGMWCTMLSIYTLPFRSGRGGFITAMLLSWWDALRCIWLYWAGMIRVGVALVGWVIGSLRFALLLLKSLVISLFRSPLTLLDWTSRRYFKPGVPWIAFMVLVIWSAVEATVFTFTLQPTLNEVFSGLTGFEPRPIVMFPLLWLFLFMLIGGSFACVQVLSEAVESRKVGTIVQMIIVEAAVMFFEVMFLYRELIDAITPWIAQQTGGEMQLGITATLGLASFGWVGVRGMSWFLFGRFGTPALLAILSRQTITHAGGATFAEPPVQPEFWRAPVDALKKETAWFHEEAKRMFELLSIPVMQLLAAALNFAVVVMQSRPVFSLPFSSIDDMLVATPFATRGRDTLGDRSGRAIKAGGVHTPRSPMPRVAP
ncbi:MAG: hypothetical protein ABR499_21995 [Gemmatimonadaceae bacterium]